MKDKLQNLNNLLDTFFMYRTQAVKAKIMFYISCFIMFLYIFLSVSSLCFLMTLSFSIILKIISGIVLCSLFYILFLLLKEKMKHYKIMLSLYREKLSEMFVLVFEVRQYINDEETKDIIAIRNVDLKLFLVNPNI